MKSNKFFQNSAIVTAVLASLCCITPVLAVLGGLSGIATTFSFLEPLRPYFIALTAIILGYAFYKAYKPKKQNDIDCACETDGTENKKNFINSKAFLWMITGISVVLITFPYYSKVLFPNKDNVVIVQSNNIVKAKLNIEGMTCTGCEESINYALKNEPGVVSATSSYKTGIAYVEYDQTKVKPEQLRKVVEENVGYKVKNIERINN